MALRLTLGPQTYFQSLRDTWWAPTPEMDRFTAAHSARYEVLLTKARTDKSLPGFFKMKFSSDGNWKEGRSEEEIEYAAQFSSELIEFIWMVFNQLELVLPENATIPTPAGGHKFSLSGQKSTSSRMDGRDTDPPIQPLSGVSPKAIAWDCPRKNLKNRLRQEGVRKLVLLPCLD